MRRAELLLLGLFGCGSTCPMGRPDAARAAEVRQALTGLPGGAAALQAHPDLRICFADQGADVVLSDETAVLEEADPISSAARLAHLLRHLETPIGEPTGDCDAFVQRALSLERAAWAEEQRLRVAAGLAERTDEATALAQLQDDYWQRCRAARAAN